MVNQFCLVTFGKKGNKCFFLTGNGNRKCNKCFFTFKNFVVIFTLKFPQKSAHTSDLNKLYWMKEMEKI